MHFTLYILDHDLPDLSNLGNDCQLLSIK